MSALNTSLPSLQVSDTLSKLQLDNTLRAALIGVIIVAILFGVTSLQALIYYTSSTHDPRYMRCIVAFLWFLDAFHLALISDYVYFYLVTNFTNISIITKPTWSLCLHVFVTTISNFVVRIYYTRRVWIMSKQNRIMTLFPAILTIVTTVSGLVFGAKIFTYHSTLQFANVSWMLYLSLGAGVCVDLWVATSLCYFLAKSRTGFKSTDTKISILMMYIINTGLLTSLCALSCLITYASMPDNLIFIALFFCLPKLYFNSLLAMLNARDRPHDVPSRHANSNGEGQGIYQMQHIVHVGKTPNATDTASFGTIGTTPFSLARTGHNTREKDNIALAVSVEMETNYHSDDVVSKSEKFSSVLPI